MLEFVRTGRQGARKARTEIRPRRRRPVHVPFPGPSARRDTGFRVATPPPAPARVGDRPNPRTERRSVPPLVRPAGAFAGPAPRSGSIAPGRARRAGQVQPPRSTPIPAAPRAPRRVRAPGPCRSGCRPAVRAPRGSMGVGASATTNTPGEPDRARVNASASAARRIGCGGAKSPASMPGRLPAAGAWFGRSPARSGGLAASVPRGSSPSARRPRPVARAGRVGFDARLRGERSPSPASAAREARRPIRPDHICGSRSAPRRRRG